MEGKTLQEYEFQEIYHELEIGGTQGISYFLLSIILGSNLLVLADRGKEEGPEIL